MNVHQSACLDCSASRSVNPLPRIPSTLSSAFHHPIAPGGDAVITLLSSPNPAGGPWTCLGGDE